jgi:16S rRNA (guanine527-N7)-methyltransferase
MDRGSFPAAARALGIELPESAPERLARFFDLLRAGNERAALTSVDDEPGFWRTHALDSLTVARALAGEARPPLTVVDVGSGAGIPAIPLAIAFSDLAVTAIESVKKKARFIEEAAAALDLAPRLRVLAVRAEDAARDPSLRECFDLAVARAVADLPVLAEYCLPFVRRGGLFIAYKGPKAADETERARNAFAELGGALEAVIPAGIEGTDLRLVKVRKTAPTPAYYPRKAGLPAKRPL